MCLYIVCKTYVQRRLFSGFRIVIMMTLSNGNLFRVTGPICVGNSPVTREFPSQRPVTRSFDVFFDLFLNKRLSKQSWEWWFETPWHSLWRHCSVLIWSYQGSHAIYGHIFFRFDSLLPGQLHGNAGKCYFHGVDRLSLSCNLQVEE